MYIKCVLKTLIHKSTNKLTQPFKKLFFPKTIGTVCILYKLKTFNLIFFHYKFVFPKYPIRKN